VGSRLPARARLISKICSFCTLNEYFNVEEQKGDVLTAAHDVITSNETLGDAR
jgi:hypothetical protein